MCQKWDNLMDEQQISVSILQNILCTRVQKQTEYSSLPSAIPNILNTISNAIESFQPANSRPFDSGTDSGRICLLFAQPLEYLGCSH